MRYLLLAMGISVGDLSIKKWIEEKRNLHEERKVCGGKIVVRRYHNRGACLNLGEKNPILVRSLSLGLTLTVFLLLCATLGQKGNRLLKTGLSLLLGGAFSNTYDRLKRKYVVDYFSFSTGLAALDRVVFNLADFCILTGAMLAAFGAE